MRVVIRPARLDDLTALGAAFVAAGRAAWGHILGREALEHLAPRRLEAQLETPAARTAVLVAEVDGEIAGYVVARPSADADATEATGEIDGFFTHPDVWGAGVGRSLMDAGLSFLRDAGFREATLWTAERNDRPRRVYERGGWRPDGAVRHRELRGSEFDELRYRIEL